MVSIVDTPHWEFGSLYPDELVFTETLTEERPSGTIPCMVLMIRSYSKPKCSIMALSIPAMISFGSSPMNLTSLDRSNVLI